MACPAIQAATGDVMSTRPFRLVAWVKRCRAWRMDKASFGKGFPAQPRGFINRQARLTENVIAPPQRFTRWTSPKHC